ncbi:uncharacterized protein LOC135169790 [Diachasmimorpha longicaudata]|uniref:uncharacterized protein LOC135169790 n=1 Tax=Diachasmimorpha longicaudata TaxID=58733 RepID=UPI0030B8E796
MRLVLGIINPIRDGTKVLDLQQINKPTAESLGSRASTVVETLDQLNDVPGLDAEKITEQFFAHILRRSLDVDTLKQWEVKLGTSKDFPSLQEFVDFLEAYGRSLNTGASLKDHQESAPANKKLITKIKIKRNEFVVNKELCFRCQGPHRKPKCKSTKTCHECNRDHRTLIHNGSSWTTAPPVGAGFRATETADDRPKPGTSTTSSEINNQRINERSTEIYTVHHPEEDQQAVLLATARLRAHSTRGFMVKARALIDQGSELSFITDQIAHQLQLKTRPSLTELIGISGINSGITQGIVNVSLQSIQGQKQITISAHVLTKLTTTLPSFSRTLADIGSLKNLQLANPQYLRPGPIDLIKGANYSGRIIENQIIKSRRTAVVGQCTAFGWILSGPFKCTSCSTKISLSAVRESSNEQLLELLQKFWVQEELSIQHQHSELSTEELECEKHFQETHRRDESGRYIVRLPLRTSSAALGNSKNKASRQLRSVISRLNKDQAYSQLYKEFIKEYEELGHMKGALEIPEPSTAYYLPHHGVLREDAITTKFRVVFNGSSASSSGMSLNNILYPGVKLQINVMNVLTWMRKHKLVFRTEIIKMFRQSEVHQDDWDLQRILWIDDNQQQLTFQLTTVTHGLNCSPWLSLRVLQQLVEDEGHRFPAAVEAITRGRYVDDIYGGSDSEEGFKEIAVQLQGLCKAGGFDLQKWSSNCPEALHQLGLTTESSLIQFEESVTKVLGLCWHQSTDTFRYKSRKFTAAIITKRTVSSEIAQIFDPLGFIASVVVQGKVLLQELWKLKVNWDDPLPDEYKNRWRTFRGDLTNLDRVTVPRWIQLSSDTANIQIHGFADASTVAMSAVVYIRTRTINENPSTTLVCAKTKVAPIKRMTIPRLELTAALLLTQLVESTYEMLQLDRNQMETYLSSDSSVTLAWIRSPASRWKDFVHNRVTKIQETLPRAIWRHVSGQENPADCASRGISPNELADHPLWWSALSWINQDPEDWPQSTIDVSKMDTPEVAKEAKPVPAHPARMKISKVAELLNRYSSMAKLLAVTATINRAIDRFSRRPTPPGPVLTTRELNEARVFWVKVTQAQYFESAMRLLQRDHQLPRSHQLAKLTPTLDDRVIMRLGSRLKNSQLSPEEIHPIILPRQSRFTTLVMAEAPQRTQHRGGRGTVRAYIFRCAICTRHRGRQAQQQMGQLPSTRISPARAFLHTGVGYAGPFPILKWRPINAQPGTVHIAVFVCFTTSAVHLEFVNRQTTEAFIGAYKRFTGRRGIPAVMYSDNATTFTGAAKVLEQVFHQESRENQQCQAVLATHGTQWNFIPPRALHFGGKWEVAVKSVKHYLKRILGPSTLTYEELNSVIIQIETCLNSRAIGPMSDDPEDLQVLTPGHFLVGEPLHRVSEPSLLQKPSSKLQRWNLVTQITQQFWSRWSKECLQTYQAIYKGKNPHENIKVGDLVVMMDASHQIHQQRGQSPESSQRDQEQMDSPGSSQLEQQDPKWHDT